MSDLFRSTVLVWFYVTSGFCDCFSCGICAGLLVCLVELPLHAVSLCLCLSVGLLLLQRWACVILAWFQICAPLLFLVILAWFQICAPLLCVTECNDLIIERDTAMYHHVTSSLNGLQVSVVQHHVTSSLNGLQVSVVQHGCCQDKAWSSCLTQPVCR